MDDRSLTRNPTLPGLTLTPDPEGLDYTATVPPAEAPRYTAAEFLKRQPNKAKQVVELLGLGAGQLRIAAMVGCSVHTVRELMRQIPDDIAIARKRQLEEFKRLTALGLEALAEKLSDPKELAAMSPRDLAVVIGILDDHSKGSSPAAVTVNINAPGHEDLAGYLAKLQRADPVPPQAGAIGFDRETGETKGAGADREIEEAETVEDAGDMVSEGQIDIAVTDSESVNIPDKHQQKGNK